MEHEFFIEGCELFDTPFAIDGAVYAIRDMWTRIDCEDSCYHENISPYCINYFDVDNLPVGVLAVTDLRFFQAINDCNKYCIFHSKPTCLSKYSDTDFYRSTIYNAVINELIFIGWDVLSGEGSAFTDGNIYPIYLSDGLSGDLCYMTQITDIKSNQFGLIDDLKDCQVLCDLNNAHPKNYNPSYPNNTVYWYPSGIYVDKQTYLKIKP